MRGKDLVNVGVQDRLGKDHKHDASDALDHILRAGLGSPLLLAFFEPLFIVLEAFEEDPAEYRKKENLNLKTELHNKY